MSIGTPVRAAVLGAGGFIGSAVVRHLLRSGLEVVAVDQRHPTPSTAEYLAGSHLIVDDICRAGALHAALDGVDQVIYAVGSSYPADSMDDLVRDTAHTLEPLFAVLERLRSMPTVGLTFLSSGGTVYGDPGTARARESDTGDPLSSYGILKLASEKYVALYARLYGVRGRVLRVANAYGPLQQPGRGQGAVIAFLDAARHGVAAPLFGDGSAVRDYVHVDDVASVIATLLGRPDCPPVLNVGTGIGHTLTDVLAVVEAATGRTVDVRSQPVRAVDVPSIVLDVTALRTLIEWHPISLEAGVRRTWEELLSSGKAGDRQIPEPA